MIITDRFILLNMSKTGSTFVRTVLKQLHGANIPLIPKKLERWILPFLVPSFREIFFPHKRIQGLSYMKPHQHGKYSQVPEKYRHLPVVMIVRNPFDRLISQYHFRWWATHPIADKRLIQDHFPTFPAISFQDFLAYKNFEARLRLGAINSQRDSYGCQTIEYIQMVSKKPKILLHNLNDEYISSGNYRKHLPNLTLLTTENLNQDIYDFLIKMDYPPSAIEFIRTANKAQPIDGTDRTRSDTIQSHYSYEMIKDVRYEERFLFRMLRDFGINY